LGKNLLLLRLLAWLTLLPVWGFLPQISHCLLIIIPPGIYAFKPFRAYALYGTHGQREFSYPDNKKMARAKILTIAVITS
jgi:hypothetical protein